MQFVYCTLYIILCLFITIHTATTERPNPISNASELLTPAEVDVKFCDVLHCIYKQYRVVLAFTYITALVASPGCSHLLNVLH